MARQAKTTQQLIDSGQEVLISGTSAGDDIPVSQGTLSAGEDLTNGVMKVEGQFNYHYQAAADTDVVIKASPGYLKGIILGGLGVADSIIEVSDHASDGDGNVMLYLAGGDGTTDLNADGWLLNKMSYIPVEAVMGTGITADITNATHVTFIYR